MKKIATIDLKDYGKFNKIQLRKASRAIVIRDNKILMIKSQINGDYKFPGGGQHVFETPIETLVRETKEETGYDIIQSSIREFGYVEEIRKSNNEEEAIFKMISQYYLCDVGLLGDTKLDKYEEDLKYETVLVDPQYAYENNMKIEKKDIPWIKRENLVLNQIIKYINGERE